MLKKCFRVFYSMKLAITVLLLIIAACTAGSLIRQEQTASWYAQTYGEQGTKWILTFGLDQVFTCWWFVVLTVLLCINLLLCSVIRYPKIRRNIRHQYTLQYHRERMDGDFAYAVPLEAVRNLPQKLGFRNPVQEEENGTVWTYLVRNKAGLWGSWLCHVGMLLIIVGFAAGQMLSEEYVVYGVPGEILPIEGTPYELQINDFTVELREDYTVQQYTADLTMRNTETTQEVSGQAQVNHPMDAFGMRLYQNSTGWAAKVSVYKKDELQKSEILCTGEMTAPEDFEELVYVFSSFYPDYANDGGMPYTKTPLLNNPRAVFTLYYQGEILAMNEVAMGAPVTVDDYRFVMEEPQQYTLVQIVRDPTMKLVGLGGLVTLLALLLSFYVRTEELWYQKEADGSCTVYGKCRKGAEIFAERVREAAGLQVNEQHDGAHTDRALEKEKKPL